MMKYLNYEQFVIIVFQVLFDLHGKCFSYDGYVSNFYNGGFMWNCLVPTTGMFSYSAAKVAQILNELIKGPLNDGVFKKPPFLFCLNSFQYRNSIIILFFLFSSP